MASDFLKKKAQEQAESVTKRFGEDAYGGTKWRESQQETNGKEGGNKPSSTQSNRYESTRASSFLSKKAEEQAASITERFGEDAYGGTKWRSENSALSSGALSQLLQQVQGLGTPGATADTKRTSGGYYSRPVAPEGIEDIYSSVSYLTPALREAAIPVTVAQEGLQAAEADLKIVNDYLQRAMDAYKTNPSAANADTYNQIVAKYDEIYQGYAAAYDAYNAAYNKYKSTEDQAVQILNAYQNYSTAQQAAFDDWRGTIRDAATIQTEITAIDQQMADLEVAEAAAAEAARQQQLAEYQARQDAKPWYEKLAGYLGGVQDTTLPLAGVTPGTVEAAFNQPEKTPSREMQQLIAMKELLQEELNWSQYYYYADFAGAPDFAEMSKYVPQEEKEQRALDIMLDNYSSDAAPWEDPLYEYINGNEEAGAWLSNAGANYYGPDNAIGAFFGRATENKAESQQMTEQEVATFNYLYATQGKAAAHAYYDYLLADLNYRQRKSEEEYWAAEAAKNPVGTSVFSVVMSPAKGLSYIGQLGDWLPDHELEPNAAYNKFSYTNTAIRSQVAKQIEESGKWGKVGSFAYQTGMSMADFLLASAISGNNQVITLTVMGSGAAADATISAKDRGLSDNQAFALGTIAGILEGGIEALNMDTVFKPDALKDGVIRYILKNATAEGAEEVATDIGNLVFDVLIAADQNVLQASIDNYMKQGLTENEAVARTFADQALQMASDFAGGFMSGGILSGTNAGIHVNYTNQMGNELGELDLDEEDIQAFIETGLESDPETASYQLAVEMQAKIEAGETLSNYDLARLYQANMQAIQAEEEDAEDLRDDTATDDQADAAADDVTDPGGLSLPSVENDTQAPGFVTQNTQNGTQTQVNDTVLPDGVPLSIADQLRQEQAQNGGTQYERTYERAAGPATAQPAGELYLPGGAGISDGSAERNVGAGTAEQTGVLAGGTRGRSAGQTAFASRAAIDRQSRAKNLRLEKVSSLDLGLQNGTEARNIQVMPQENWDAEMSQLADRIYNETGKGVTYVMGRIQIRGTGGAVSYARGAITGDRIIVQADHLRISMEQIADHEAYHAKAGFTGGRLNDEIRRHIVETFSEEQYRAVLETYVKQLRCVYNLTEAKTVEEYEETLNIIEEEIFADAYAGINAFGAGADQFTGAVNEKMDQLYMGKIRNQDNGTEEPTGPPSDRYSFAGENANNADLDALARAKEMQAAGVADETIRQQTGWHTGMDGKWRWEIDDSGMEYSGRGDLGLRERRPEYARYRELLDKANRHALELSDEALTPEEAAELQKLKNIWGGTFRKAGRITEDALPTELLSDYVKHDALFEAYPQLRKTRLRFAELPEGTRGQYDPEQDVITLSESLRGKPQDTLIHEIQHVIQKAEGFSRGSSVEYWAAKLTADRQREVELADKKYREIFDSMPEELKDKVRAYNRANLDYDYDEAIAIENELLESEYGELFSAWQDADFERRNLRERYKAADLSEDAITNYRNTAGEIEARDAASRRQLTVEQRRNTAPARADDRTVFVEDIDEVAFAELDAQYGPQLQSVAEFDQDTISSNIQQVAQMEPVTSISGQEFAKGEVDLITQVETFFNQRGNRAYSPELGEVILDRKGVKSDIAHGIGRKKAAAFAAVPDVIEHGLVVDYQKDWKGRGYDTAVVAAPITIGDQTHAAAVILLRSDQTNRFYVHEVLAMENGALPFKTGTREGYPGGDAPSILSILDKIRSVKNETVTQERFSMDDATTQQSQEQKPAAPKKKIRPVAESRPLIAKKDLRNTVLNLFSIPNGQRAEVGAMIDSYADRLIKNGSLTEDDRKAFFDRMYDAGVMVMPAEEYSAFARSHIVDGRIYVSDSVKVQAASKKAIGTVVCALLMNAVWSEAVSFLMALWKNKGKYYRDDEDELTAESVIGEMGRNMMESIMGTVTFGDEIAQLIGNAITGDRRYDLEAPGLEQINEIFNLVQDLLQGNFGRISEAADVVKNGGNLGEYLSDNSGEILGEIKDTATKVATYFGLPVNNVEAYLLGTLKWVSPKLGTAYDDLFQSIGKSDLAGMEGSALEGRIGRILSDRNVSESDDTAAALAALYEAGYKTAIPSDTPTSVSIDGEKHSLGDYQQQAYDTIWGGIVADALDDMVASDSFKEADPKTQAKMLSNLYTYAAEQAKAELFDEYELDSGATKNAAIVAAGATVAECITWNTIASEMKSGEKSAELASWDIPEEAKREIFRCKISDSRENSIAAFDEAGLSFDQFLQAYSMYGQINNEDLKAGMKAVEFSHWVNAQGYTAEQAAVVKDELTYFNMTPASSSRYDELVGAGMDPDEAYDLTGALNELQPADGEDEVSDLQKWRASVDFSDDVEDQLAALSAVMTDAQFQKVEIANNFGVSPDAYVTLQEIKPQYDADGNGSYKNAEIKAAVDGMPGYYTTEQKAVLWQLATGSTSSRNNPYSRQVGQQVLDARAAAKEAAAQEQTEAPTDSTDDDSFSQALLDQLLGRG